MRCIRLYSGSDDSTGCDHDWKTGLEQRTADCYPVRLQFFTLRFFCSETCGNDNVTFHVKKVGKSLGKNISAWSDYNHSSQSQQTRNCCRPTLGLGALQWGMVPWSSLKQTIWFLLKNCNYQTFPAIQTIKGLIRNNRGQIVTNFRGKQVYCRPDIQIRRLMEVGCHCQIRLSELVWTNTNNIVKLFYCIDW